MTQPKVLAVIPFSADYEDGRLFVTGSDLDRDGVLQPWAAFADSMRSSGWIVDTADRLDRRLVNAWLHLDSAAPPPPEAQPARTILMMFEPEVVHPYWYVRARRQRLQFATVFTHSEELVATGPPYEHLHSPQVLGRAPGAGRSEFLVMVNNRKYPAVRRGELYSAREKVASWFARQGLLRIYGKGWDHSDPRHPVSAFRTRALKRAAAGTVASKFEVLGRARFSLSFENMTSPGYHSEKLFDAIAAGSVPVYLGDPNIRNVVPAEAYIDYARVGSPKRLCALLQRTSDADQLRIQDAGRRYLESESFRPYTVDAFAQRLRRRVEAIA
jgi:Glycosyltransferase family 10 (fucosyltransferase) C-term